MLGNDGGRELHQAHQRGAQTETQLASVRRAGGLGGGAGFVRDTERGESSLSLISPTSQGALAEYSNLLDPVKCLLLPMHNQRFTLRSRIPR